MTQATPLWTPTITSGELEPVVAQVLGRPHGGVAEWRMEPIGDETSGSQLAGGRGIYRVVGSAHGQAAGQLYPWSLVVKIFSDAALGPTPNDIGATIQDPTDGNYWKREILAYQSGMLDELAGGLAAPRCYGVTEHAGEWRLWLEDVEESPKTWPLERYGVAARHLGQFNGAYLVNRPLPVKQPWMYRGRARDWSELVIPWWDDLPRYAATEAGRRWLSTATVTRVQNFLAQRDRMVAVLDRLPLCLCHHDAFRRNLLARDTRNTTGTGATQTVAVDWSMLGYGAMGEDPAITTAVGLSWLHVAADHATAFDDIVFTSYLQGLRDAGWQGDPRLPRFGYTAATCLVIGASNTIAWCRYLQTEGSDQYLASLIGHPAGAVFAQWAVTVPFLLDLGDEALHLADELL